MKILILILTIIFSELSMSQNFTFEQQLYHDYDNFKEKSLTNRRFKHSDILPLIERLKNNKDFIVNKVGTSYENRDLFLITAGHGKTKVFLWSQMHGDEPTATAALFDIFNFFEDSSYNEVKSQILSKVKLYFLPMVNPDGAERFIRRNYFDVDINRDAARLQTPESIILRNVFDSLNADFGFNLHDQDPRYSVGNSYKSAAISFLAPAFNYEKDVNQVRERSILLIGRLTRMLNKFIPGHIAKYSDEFEPRAFGDMFQKLGTSTILVESGGWKNDPEKQFIRKMNFLLLIFAFKEIAEQSYKNESPETYNKIPFNNRYLYDLLLRNLTLNHNGTNLKIDIAVNFMEYFSEVENRIFKRSVIQDIGDLSIFFGLEDLNLSGYEIQTGKTSNNKQINLNSITDDEIYDLYSNGYTMLSTGDSIDGWFTELPLNLKLGDKPDQQELPKIGRQANFLLLKDGEIEYVIVNGFLQKVQKGREFKGNGIIYK